MTHTLIGGAITAVGFIGASTLLGILGMLMVAAGVLYLVLVAGKKQKEYKRFYKNHVVRQVLEEYLDDVHFAPDQGIDKRLIEDTEMMTMGNRYYSNDYIKASYKGTDFFQADVCIQHHHSNGKNSYTVTYFKGRWFVFEFNKNFAHEMQIKEKSFSYSKVKKGVFTPKSEKFTEIKFEDVEFNKVFSTYARNEQEAFYIVTPHFMQNLMAFNNAVHGDILMCFIDNKLHLALHNNQDAFEPGLFTRLDPEADRQNIMRDISVITQFVERLKLDNDIFKQ